MAMRYLVAALLAGAAAAVADAPWPMFQGNAARTGACKAPGIAKPAVRWKTYIGIQGYLNDPVLADGRVFVGSSGKLHNKPDAADGVYCVDAKTGKIVWQAKTDKDACGVAYDQGAIFSTGDDGVLRAFQAKDGQVLWTLQRPGELYSQPLPMGELVLVGDSTGQVLAVGQKSGKVVWSVKAAGSNVRGGLSSDGQRIFASLLEGKVVCLDRKGEILWGRAVFEQRYWRAYPAPTVAGKMLLVGYARHTYYATPALRALDCETGRPVWKWTDQGFDGLKKRQTAFGNIRSSVAIWGDVLLYGEPYGNSLVALGRKDGRLRWWVELGAAMFPHWPSPAIASDTLYLPRHDGGLYAVDLRARKQAWMLYLGDHAKVAPKLPEGIMPEDEKHCAWQPAVGQPLFASPAIAADGTLYVGSGEGYLYAVGEAKK